MTGTETAGRTTKSSFQPPGGIAHGLAPDVPGHHVVVEPPALPYDCRVRNVSPTRSKLKPRWDVHSRALRIGLVASVKPSHPYLKNDPAQPLDFHHLRISPWLWFRWLETAQFTAMAVNPQPTGATSRPLSGATSWEDTRCSRSGSLIGSVPFWEGRCDRRRCSTSRTQRAVLRRYCCW